MATREITKRDPRFAEPEPDSELTSEIGEDSRQKNWMVAAAERLWEQRRFLFRCALIGVVLSASVALLTPKEYTSTTRLMPPDQSSSGMASMLATLGRAAGGELGAVGGDLLGLKTSGDLFVGVLESRTVQDDVVNKFDLRKVYRRRDYESTRKALEHSTQILADRKSGIITISVTDKSQTRAAAMAAEYVEALNRVVTTLNTSSAHKERAFLEGRLVEVQQDLEASEKDFSEFASKNTAIDVKEQGKAMIGAAAQLEGQLIAAETELEGLRQTYTANNVRVRSVQASIDEYRRQLDKMGGKVPAAATETSGDQATTPQKQDLYPSIRQLPILGVTWADLYRKTKVEETVLETLTEQYELAKVEEARETPSVKVLDPGEVPERKSYPPRTFFVVFGTGLALALGSMWVLARARWNEIDPSEPGKMLAVEIAQTIRSRARSLRKGMWRQTNRFGSRDGNDADDASEEKTESDETHRGPRD